MPSHLHSARERHAHSKVASFFKKEGLDFTEPAHVHGHDGIDGQLIKDGLRYVAEVKTLSEGRSDRVIPLLSQAIIQAQRYAADNENSRPLAVLYVEHAPASMFGTVARFLDKYRPDAAIAVVTPEGLGLLRWEDGSQVSTGVAPGEQVTSQNLRRHSGAIGSAPTKPFNLFSDLNQWLLKVLLAPEINEGMLEAPRQQYSSGAELANAANCSQMSASRLLQHLRQEGFLDEEHRSFRIVRRAELFERWRAANMRTLPELPMRFTVRIGIQQQLKKLLTSETVDTCLGLFAAADALGMGHVSGVPPYVYVPKLPGFANNRHNPAWAGVTLLPPTDAPDFIVRQPIAPDSTFKGAVHRDGFRCTDVIQAWLDVSSHPSRGQEQADHIFQTVLQPLIGKADK